MRLEHVDAAFTAKLIHTYTPNQPVGTLPIAFGTEWEHIPVQFGLVDEWLAQNPDVAVNVSRGVPIPDTSRLIAQNRLWEVTATGNKTRLVRPYRLLYQVDIIAPDLERMNALVETILTRIPPLGFGSLVTVNGVDCPLELVDQKDLTSYATTAKREFRFTLTYGVEVWLEPVPTVPQAPEAELDAPLVLAVLLETIVKEANPHVESSEERWTVVPSAELDDPSA